MTREPAYPPAQTGLGFGTSTIGVVQSNVSLVVDGTFPLLSMSVSLTRRWVVASTTKVPWSGIFSSFVWYADSDTAYLLAVLNRRADLDA